MEALPPYLRSRDSSLENPTWKMLCIFRFILWLLASTITEVVPVNRTIKFVLQNIIAVLFILSPVGMIVLLGTNSDWFEAQTGLVQAVLIVALILYLVAVLLIVFKAKFFVQLTDETDVRDHTRARRKSVKNNRVIEHLSIDRRKYSGVKKVYTRLKWSTGVVLVFLNVLFAFFEFYDAQYYWGLIPTLFPIVIFSYFYFLKRIIISPEGIQYNTLFKKRFLRWDKVKTVGVSANWAPFCLVFVSGTKMKYAQSMTARDVEDMISFKFRPEMIHHILCFWDGDIVNLQNVRAWRKYLMNNGTTSGQINDVSDTI